MFSFTKAKTDTAAKAIPRRTARKTSKPSKKNKEDKPMYLNIGKGNVLDMEDIVGIFDLDITSQSHLTRAYLAAAEKAGEVVNASSDDIPKSFIVTARGDLRRVHLAQPASATLLKRAENGL